MKIRSGCDGGGKGPLVQEELSATLATHQDQTLFELRNTVLNDQGGGFMEVTHGMTGALRAQEHGHAPITFDKIEGAKNR
jgi:DNA (cytosine-5)-methyltransferase 1